MGRIGRRPRAPGFILIIDAVFTIVAMLAFAGALMVVGGVMGKVLGDTFLALSVGIPDFSYSLDGLEEMGNPTFDVYQQMKLIAGVLLGPVIIIGVAMSVVEARSGDQSLATNTNFGRMVVKPAAFLVVIMAFPFLWDMGSEFSEIVALWILNPNYSFDPDKPCPADWYDDPQTMIIDRYNESPYKKGQTALWFQTDVGENFCRPDFKTNYLITQVVEKTELQDDLPPDILDTVIQTVTGALTGLYTTIIFGVAKAIVAMQLSMTAVIVGTALDVFVAVTIATMPLFAVLSMLPQTQKVASKFLMLIPAMLLLPIMTAILIVVGSGFIASIPNQYDNYTSGPFDAYLIHAWVASLGTLYLIITLPLMLLPMLKETFGLISSHVEKAFRSAAVVTSFGMKAGQQGMGAGRNMVQDFGQNRGERSSGVISGVKDTLMGRFSGGGK